MEEVDHVFSIVVAGDSNAGKTSLINRLSKDIFLDIQDSGSTSFDGLMYSIIVKLENCLVRLNIWDTTGIDDYKALNSAHFADAQGCIFLYSMNDPKSLKNLSYKWKRDFEKDSMSPHVFFLVGTKYDLPKEEYVVKEEDVKETALMFDAQAFCISSLTGFGIDDLKKSIAETLVEKLAPKHQENESSTQIDTQLSTTEIKVPKNKKKEKKTKKDKFDKKHKSCLIF